MLGHRSSIIIILLTMAISGYLLTGIIVSNTPSSYVPSTLPSRVINDQLRKEFRNDDTLYLLFKSENVINKNFLKKISKMINDIESLDLTNKVFSIFNYDHIYGSINGFEVGKIIDHSDIETKAESIIKAEVLKDKYVKDLLITKDFKTLGILIEPKDTHKSLTKLNYENEIMNIIHKNKLKSNLQAVGGNFAIQTAQFRELRRTMRITIPATFIIGIILLLLLFNSLKAVMIGVAMNLVITTIVVSFFPLFGWYYNMASAMIPTLMMALTIATLIHLYNSIYKNKENGIPHTESILNARKDVFKPTLYSALTTAAGLFSLAASPIPPIHHIGVIGGIGVFVIFLVTMYLLPPLLIRFDNGIWKQNKVLKKIINKKLNFLLKIVLNHPVKSSTIIIAILLAAGPFISNVKTESNLFKFFPDDHFINISNKKIQNTFTGTTVVHIVLDSKNNSQLISKEFLKKIEGLQSQIEKVPNVRRVFSHLNIFKEINWAFNNQNEEFRSIPSSNELSEQYLFIYSGEDMFDFLRRDQSRAKIQINIDLQGANEVGEVIKKIEKLTKDSLDGLITWNLSGQGKLFSDQEDLMMGGVKMSLIWSLAIITLLMILLWRSVSQSLLCMIPNISPILVMFIIMGIFDIWLDFGTAMISSVTIGIAIDDTIHIFHGVKKRLLEGLNIDDALYTTLHESGRAVVITTIILTTQFLILTASQFSPLKNFGLLTSIGLFTALIFDLVLLPAILKLSYKYIHRPTVK